MHTAKQVSIYNKYTIKLDSIKLDHLIKYAIKPDSTLQTDFSTSFVFLQVKQE